MPDAARSDPAPRAEYFGIPWEKDFGYAQGVKVGGLVLLSGQVGVGADGVGRGMEQQVRLAYENVARVLAMFESTMTDVVDELIFVTDMAAAELVLPAIRREVYGGAFRMASTLIGVAALGSPDLLVEIKCTAAVR